MPPSPEPWRAGAVIDGRYSVELKLGEGGMGEVWLARDFRAGRAVALKVLSASLAGETGLVRRFEREARVGAALRHENLVAVLGFGTHGGRPFLAMEALSGETLARAIHGCGAFTLRRAVPVVRAVAAALDFLHARGHVHRDVKPGNVFLCDDGRVVLLDLGVVRDASAPGDLTVEGTLLGTPHYCAPEQASGGPVDGRADVYALGVTVYEMLTGTVPFRGSEDALLAQHRDTPVPDVRWRAPEIPRAAAKAVASAMAKLPGRRPRTAARLARTLELAAVPSAFRRLLAIS